MSLLPNNPAVLTVSIYSRGGHTFCLQAKFENYFSSRAALFKKVSYVKVKTSEKFLVVEDLC